MFPHGPVAGPVEGIEEKDPIMNDAKAPSRARSLLFATLAVLALSLSWSTPAAAGPTREFHEGMAEAFAHYRQALFYLRRGAPDVAALELESFAEKWRAVTARFGDAPPDIYAADPAWRASFDDIASRAEQGLTAALAGDGEAAQKALSPLRAAAVDLRRRNGVFLFADCIAEANAAFRELFHFRRNPPGFTDAKETNRLRQRLAVSIHWYGQCRDQAPKALADNPNFTRLIDDSLFYLDRMWVAIAEKNQLAVVNILRRVVSTDDLLWLRFG